MSMEDPFPAPHIYLRRSSLTLLLERSDMIDTANTIFGAVNGQPVQENSRGKSGKLTVDQFGYFHHSCAARAVWLIGT